MSGLSPDQSEVARKNYSTFLQQLASVGQNKVAEALGQSETSISRWKNGEVETVMRALARLGLQVVPVSAPYVDRSYLAALKTIARHALDAEVQAAEPTDR